MAFSVVVVTSPPVAAEFLEAKVDLKKVSGNCVSTPVSPPSKVASRKGDLIWWTLTNIDCSNPKLKFSVGGAPGLFKKCRDGATGSDVDLTGPPILVTGTVRLVCPVDYVTVLGNHPHINTTPPKKVKIFIRDVARATAACTGPPPEADRAEWLKKCRSAELELEVVP